MRTLSTMMILLLFIGSIFAQEDEQLVKKHDLGNNYHLELIYNSKTWHVAIYELGKNEEVNGFYRESYLRNSTKAIFSTLSANKNCSIEKFSILESSSVGPIERYGIKKPGNYLLIRTGADKKTTLFRYLGADMIVIEKELNEKLKDK